MLKYVGLSVFALLAVCGAAFADAGYIDDRSSPEAVVKSMYNAINRHEIVRAYSYWDGSTEVPDFGTFSHDYDSTYTVDLRIGARGSLGAAGSVYFGIPVAIRTTDTLGQVAQFAGCYSLRQIQPGIQAQPPFRPIFIVSGHLKRVKGALDAVLPRKCP